VAGRVRGFERYIEEENALGRRALASRVEKLPRRPRRFAEAAGKNLFAANYLGSEQVCENILFWSRSAIEDTRMRVIEN